MNAMRTTLVCVACLWSVVAAAEGLAIAITDVSLVPMDSERVVPGQTVLIRGGRIVEIAASETMVVDEAVRRIDGRGRYLMPGLAEMHAHVPPQADDPQWIQDVLYLYVANGITFARSMLGAPHHLPLRDRAARGEIIAPRIYTSGPSLNGNSVNSPAHGRAMVAAQQAAGYDFLKIHPGLDRERFDAIVAEAHARGISFGGHVSNKVGLARALEARQATIDHLDEYIPALLRDDSPKAGMAPMFFGWNLADEVDEAKIAPVARRTFEAGTWVVPTESLMQHVMLPSHPIEALLARPEMRYMPGATISQWVQATRNFRSQSDYDPQLAERFIEVRAKLIKALHDEGAGLLLGSDAPQIFNVPGFAIHHELRMLIAAGLTPYDALATGSLNVARFLGEEQEFGTVAVGRRADLILLEANPLEDIAHLQRRAGVLLAGRWLPEEELQAGLDRIAARHQ